MVKMDHQPSANEAALRMPSLSENQPPGKLSSAYANAQTNAMSPICVTLKPNCFSINGFETLKFARSM